MTGPLMKKITKVRSQIADLSAGGSTDADRTQMLLDLVSEPLRLRLQKLMNRPDMTEENLVKFLTEEEQIELARGIVRLEVRLGLRPEPAWLHSQAREEGETRRNET